MLKILIATKNPAKFTEITSYLKVPAEFLSLKDLNIKEEPVENGETFRENALIKARFYSQKTGCITLSDDGGLMIDALKGEPGVKSHRWIDASCDNEDEELISYTLQRLKDVPKELRTARFHVALAVVTPAGEELVSEAEVEGIIQDKVSPRRIKGYPYRALFYFPSLNKYYDELSEEQHELLNHRKKALEKIRTDLLGVLK